MCTALDLRLPSGLGFIAIIPSTPCYIQDNLYLGPLYLTCWTLNPQNLDSCYLEKVSQTFQGNQDSQHHDVHNTDLI